MTTDDTPKPKRTILYCRTCGWAGEMTGADVNLTPCPGKCGNRSLSYVSFHEHEKAQADALLQQDIGKAVDDVQPYETN